MFILSPGVRSVTPGQYKKFYGALRRACLRPADRLPARLDPRNQRPRHRRGRPSPPSTPQADFDKYRGKLKGKIVLIADPKLILMHTEPEARRLTDEEIEARTTVQDPSRLGAFPGAAPRPGAPAVAPPPPPHHRRRRPQNCATTPASSCPMKASSSPSTTEPTATAEPSSPASGGSQNPADPTPPPMVAITPEHYNRIARLIQHKMAPKVTFDIEAET